jgi:hypothetical protein
MNFHKKKLYYYWSSLPLLHCLRKLIDTLVVSFFPTASSTSVISSPHQSPSSFAHRLICTQKNRCVWPAMEICLGTSAPPLDESRRRRNSLTRHARWAPDSSQHHMGARWGQSALWQHHPTTTTTPSQSQSQLAVFCICQRFNVFSIRFQGQGMCFLCEDILICGFPIDRYKCYIQMAFGLGTNLTWITSNGWTAKSNLYLVFMIYASDVIICTLFLSLSIEETRLLTDFWWNGWIFDRF